MSTRNGKNLRKRKHITGLIDAIRAYYDSIEGEPGREPADILARDCITDLMHAADVFGFDFEAALATARNHYGDEYHHGKPHKPEGKTVVFGHADGTSTVRKARTTDR